MTTLTEDDLTTFSPDAKLTLVLASKVSPQSVLQDVDRRRYRVKEAVHPVPSVLWNLRPYNNFNLVHAIYLERLRYYQELGLSTVIVLYDKYLGSFSGTSSAFDEIDLGITNLRAWIKACGLKVNKTEVFLESDLWRIYSTQILERVTSLIHSPANAQILSQTSASAMLDSVFELVYESLLQVDFVLTGEDPNNIWNQFRLDSLRTLKSRVPSLLSIPIIHNPLSAAACSSRDPEFSVFLPEARIRSALQQAREEFVKQIYDYLLIPQAWPKHIRIAKVSVTSYEKARADGITVDLLRKHAANSIVARFQQLQKAKR